MPNIDHIQWQPISQMPLVARMIDESVTDTRNHLATLTKARTKRHLLDDATIDRVERVHAEQKEFAAIYAQQIQRWRADRPSATQARELDRMNAQNQQLQEVTAKVLALAAELRQGTINRIMDMSDLELGLQALLGRPLSPER